MPAVVDEFLLVAHVLDEHLFQELSALGCRREGQVFRLLNVIERRNDLERVTLVNQEGLALRGVEHLGGILRHERVEKGVEAFVVPALRSQDTAETLRLLTSGTVVGRNLDKACGLGQVKRRVSNLGEEERVDLGVVLEVLQHLQSLCLAGLALIRYWHAWNLAGFMM
ncbi:hypothetical protein HYQ46_007771 [Verticillium longisporum]|nr:hypothetical protein HYQ46_007771 [Verticillium longisporum]